MDKISPIHNDRYLKWEQVKQDSGYLKRIVMETLESFDKVLTQHSALIPEFLRPNIEKIGAKIEALLLDDER